MEDEIKVGEYIRTYKGHFDKIVIAEKEDDMYAGESNPDYLDYTSEDIKHHSFNIIDLIEVGDYVNGSKVINVSLINIKVIYTEDITKGLPLTPIVNEQIETILTKEQFKANEYIVKE